MRNPVMATDDIRISINEPDNSKMCTRSSNKIGLQMFVPSNFNTHTKVQVIEGELGNSIRKPRTKNLKEDPYQLCRMSVDTKSWSLYKVPFPLRQVNEKAYEPNVISIGPYHHGKKHLETMEVIKRNCFSKMIKKGKAKPGKFVTLMKNLEKQVRKCYEEPLDRFDSDTLVEMMVLDGCFIVLLFQENDFLFTSLGKLNTGILDDIYCDLLLLENQLPFFVLSKLYGVIMSNVEKDEFPRRALSCLAEMIPEQDICLPKKFPKPKYINHLLGLVHSSWIHSARCIDAGAEEATETEIEAEAEAVAKAEEEAEAEAEAEAKAKAKAKETKSQSLWKFIFCGTESEEPRKFIRCATELEEAGINFVNKGKKLQDKDRKDKIGASLFNIDFTDDGKLKIPTLSVDDDTERILRNFMAYEQFLSKPTYVCSYVVLMDNLINSGKDVQLLCKRGIIDNKLGDDEVVAQIFNRLSDYILISMDSDDFDYAKIFDEVNAHCKKRRNKWKARLKKDYFNSPWSTIKVLTAFVLLLLTLLQTIFSAK
ncbi:hypothetical protein CRYUN_Cryun05aG0049000 [Craigia yunnanensis]